MIDHWLHIIVPALTEIFLIVMICFIMLIDVLTNLDASLPRRFESVILGSSMSSTGSGGFRSF